MFADFEGDITAIFKDGKECDCPILTTRNMVVMPGVIVPVLLGRETSINVARYLERDTNKRVCAIVCQKDPENEFPEKKDDLYDVGVMARLVRIIEMPTSSAVTAIFQATTRCKLEKINSKRPYLKGHVVPMPESVPSLMIQSSVLSLTMCAPQRRSSSISMMIYLMRAPWRS